MSGNLRMFRSVLQLISDLLDVSFKLGARALPVVRAGAQAGAESSIRFIQAIPRLMGERIPDAAQTLDRLAIGSASTDKPISVNLLQNIFPLSGSLLLIAEQGRESMERFGDRSLWLKALGASALGTVLLSTTSGVYGAILMGLSTFRAARESNRFDQIGAVVHTFATGLMGWAGMNLGDSATIGFEQLDNTILKRMLHEKIQGETLEGFLKAISAKHALLDEQKITKDLSNLVAHIDEVAQANRQFNEGKITQQTVNQLSARLNDVKQGLLAKLDKIPAHGYEGLFLEEGKRDLFHRRFQPFIGTLGNVGKWDVQLARSLNKTFGFLVVGSLGGVLITESIMKGLRRLSPELQQTDSFRLDSFYRPTRSLRHAASVGLNPWLNPKASFSSPYSSLSLARDSQWLL